MALLDDFNAAVAGSKDLTARPNNEDLLELYALYKQATEGDVSGEKPMGFDFKAIAKYGAWERKKGLGNDAAMEQYVKLMNKLKGQ